MAIGLKLSAALAYVHGAWVGPGTGDLAFGGVSSDSRAVVPGDLFVALRGPNFDGHDFIEAALGAGALAAVADRGAWAGRPVVMVKDGVKALGHLAKGARRDLGFKALAVSGSVGKTTAKEMAKLILAAKGQEEFPGREVLATSGNLNNEVGLPLSILKALRAPVAPVYAVLEMGASALGDVAYLTEIARPDVGLLTALGPAHLESFGDLKTVARAKAELFAGLGPGGVAVANRADPLVMAELKALAANGRLKASRLHYGPGGQVWLKKTEPLGLWGQRLTIGGLAAEGLTVDLRLPGAANAFNAVAAAAAALAMGCGPLEIKKGLSATEPLAGRLKPALAASGHYVLDDSYNANPASVEAGLRFLASLDRPGPKGAILGDMLELGPKAPELHRAAGRLAASLGLDFLALVGLFAQDALTGAQEAGAERPLAAVFDGPAAAAQWARKILGGRGLVLVKGSRAGGLERAVLELLKD
ncbi:MAG: UDP-N-acetylmuramoyl-tripeptide--D-alanyl-D-alanine ligase [Deltaproteobacteria bacterium]|jgi:UDP-N-acetylmuramoyl-tripeptide--D-alanyl-D-alanine ligase|nr:UDP-N-acetylmuramoyl-tripeptide--D-alanyl-D-alanine ligase [Deltaproteobacteria bacterium]